MIIGLISDSHDHLPHLNRAIEVFKEKKAGLILHAGDYCSPFTIPLFEGLNLKGIFGNNDGDKYLLMHKFREINAELAGDFLSVHAGGLHIAMYHGTYPEITQALQECGRYDVVVSGHTHEIVKKETRDTLAVNPGTAHGFGEEATIALLDTGNKTVEFIRLN